MVLSDTRFKIMPVFIPNFLYNDLVSYTGKHKKIKSFFAKIVKDGAPSKQLKQCTKMLNTPCL